jgi:hypothetical protein
MTARPRIADDFAAIRVRLAAVQRERGAADCPAVAALAAGSGESGARGRYCRRTVVAQLAGLGLVIEP